MDLGTIGGVAGGAIGSFFGSPSAGAAIGQGAGDAIGGAFGGSGKSTPSVPSMENVSLKSSMSQPVAPPATSDTTGIGSVSQGSNPPPPGSTPTESTMGSQAPKSFGDMAADAGKKILNGAFSSAGDEASNALIQHLFHRNDAAKAGKDARKYLDSAYPELNPWEKSGAGGTMSGIQEQQFSQQSKLTKMQLDNQKDIAKMGFDNQLKIAGINSITSRQNTADSVYAQNSMLQNNIKESNARINKIAADTSLSYSQKSKAIADTIQSYAQTHNIQLTGPQIQAQTENILTNTHNAKTSKSIVGKAVDDTLNVASDLPSEAFHIIFPRFDNSPVGKVYHKVSDTFHKGQGVQGSMSRK